MINKSKSFDLPLLSLMLLHGAATLMHFAHNAIYLHDYPNMPVTWTSLGVWGAWLGLTAIGGFGYWMFAIRRELTGLLVMGVYATLGFGGFEHYVIAPVSAHSMMMNASILFEAITAAFLLGLIVYRLAQRRKLSHANVR